MPLVSCCVCPQTSLKPDAVRQSVAVPDPTAAITVGSVGLSAAALAAASEGAVCQPPTATGDPEAIDKQHGTVNPVGNVTSPVTPAVVMVPRPDAGNSAARVIPDPPIARA